MFTNPYIFKIENGDEIFIISLLGGGIVSIPKQILEILETKPTELTTEYVDYFKETEILFDTSDSFYSTFNELKNKTFEKTLNTPLNVIFTLTYNCNFKCNYCFQLRQEKNINNKIINYEIIDNAKNIVNQLELINGSTIDKSNIYLYGGEPFMANPFLLKIVRKLLDTFYPNNEIFITTNGYDLNYYEETLARYSNLNIQITIDGPKRFQDKRRQAKDKGSSFDKITSNLKLIKDLNHNIMIRINVDEENYLSICELINELKSIEIFPENEIYEHLYFAPVVNREQKEVNIDFYKSFIDYYFENLYQNKIKVSNLRALDYAIRIVEGETIPPSKYYCDAIYGKFIIDPEGNIGICEEAVLNKNQIFGSINENGSVTIKENPWKDRSVEEMTECNYCEFKYMCSGGCTWKALNCTNSYKSAMCDEFKEIFKYSMIKLLNKKFHYSIPNS